MRIPKVGHDFACLEGMVTRLGEALTEDVGEVGMESCGGAGKELDFICAFLWLVGFWFRGFFVVFSMAVFWFCIW